MKITIKWILVLLLAVSLAACTHTPPTGMVVRVDHYEAGLLIPGTKIEGPETWCLTLFKATLGVPSTVRVAVSKETFEKFPVGKFFDAEAVSGIQNDVCQARQGIWITVP
jgi:hypothetical protein